MDSMSLLWACGGAVLGGGVSWLLAQLVMQKRMTSLEAENIHLSEASEHYKKGLDIKNSELDILQASQQKILQDKATLSQKIQGIEEQFQDLKEKHHLQDKDYTNLQKEFYNVKNDKDQHIITLSEQNNGFIQKLKEMLSQLQELEEKHNAKENDYIRLQKEFYDVQGDRDQKIITLVEQNKTLLTQAEKREQDLVTLQKQFSNQFENLANRIFEDKSKAFNQQSAKTLEQALAPVRETFGDFKHKIEDTFIKHRDEQISLKENINNIYVLNKRMSQQAENLTKALKGDNKTQGNWGEMVLERLLEETGLIKGRDYILQGEGMGLVNSENNKQQRPDVIIHLPEEKHIIIDSKVSLTDYERYVSAEDKADQDTALIGFINSLKKHVKDLSSKSYQDNKNLGTPDFVFMFVPIEGAFSLAMQKAPDLHEYAWAQRIVIVSTTTLFAALRTVSSIWRIEHQNQNAQEIADQAERIYDKVYGFLTDIDKMGKQIKGTQEAYDSALNKLSTGRGNLISRTEKLKSLGVKTKKNIAKDISFAEQALELEEA